MSSKPEFTNFENGNKVARFRIATNRYNMKDKKVGVEWHRVYAWGNMAQFIETEARLGKELVIQSIGAPNLSKHCCKEDQVNEVEVKHVIGL